MSTTLPLFWHLSSASKNERLDASVKLISALEHFQIQKAAAVLASAESSDDEDDHENMTKDDLDLLNAQDVSYSIRRLIRGLASPRESSRLGFAVALTELLSRLCTVTCSQIMGLIMESTKHQGSMKGQEERDILFARLFGISSIIQSGLAVRTKPISSLASSETSASSLGCYEQIISSLLSLGDQKSWLRESAWFTINLAVDALHGSDVSWKEKAVEKTLDALFTAHSIWSTEKLALTLKMQNFFPSRDWKRYLSPIFKNTDILNTGNLAIVAKILKESATDEDGAKDPIKAPSGGWRPQLNFSWGIILDQLLPESNSEKEPKGSFQDFYKLVVDETLFSTTSPATRKYWGFQVFQKALEKADQETVPMLFTRNFMRTWINHLSKRDRYLHKIALQTATEVESFVKNKPQLGFGLILQLTGPNGSQQFDKLTKTKTVESILSVLDVKGVEQYVDHLLSQANESGVNTTDVGAINSRRAWIIDQLASVIRNQRLPRADTWIKNILDWLTIHGLFLIKKKSSKTPFSTLHSIPSPPLSDELRQSCTNKLLTCLGDLCHQIAVVTEGGSTRKIPGVASDGEFWLSKVSSVIQQLEQDTKHVVPLEEVDEETTALRVKARETLDELKTSKAQAGQEATKGAELLLLGTLLLHICHGDENLNVANPLEACVDGVARLLLSKARKKEEDSESEPIDLLVDTIIGFLEKGTSYTRSIGNLSFGLLSGLVKESTIDLIVTQLERRDPSQLIGEDEDDEMDVADLGSEEEESDSDESSGASDGEDSSDPNAEEEVDLELRRKIEEALRVNGIEPATGDTESEDEEVMDDDQMMAIDEQLAQVFRARANEKKGKNVDAQREATHFKSRVLDLVDTYLKKEPISPLALHFISPLVELSITSGQDERQLADKAKGVLRSRLGKAKEIVIADPSQILEISTTIHSMARRARSADNVAVLSLCAIYLAKPSIHAGHEESLVDLYKQDLHDFTRRKKSGLNGPFFQEFIKKYPSYGWQLRHDLIDVLKGAVNTYRQIQVIQLLQLLLNLLPSFDVSHDEVKTFMPLFRQQLLEFAEDGCKDSGNLTTAQMKEVLKLGLLGVRQTARIAPKATDSLWKSDTWRSLIEKLDASPRFKSSPVLKKLCERIARTTEASGSETSRHQSKKKRKAELLEASHQNSKKKHKSDS